MISGPNKSILYARLLVLGGGLSLLGLYFFDSINAAIIGAIIGILLSHFWQ